MRNIYRLTMMALLCLSLAACGGKKQGAEETEQQQEEVLPYGFRPTDYRCESGSVRNGDNFTALVCRLGLDPGKAYALAQACDTTFDVRRMRAGAKYDAYYGGPDSTALKYMVYKENRVTDVIFNCGDSLSVFRYEKPVVTQTLASDVTINSSLWNDMTAAGVSPDLIMELSDIYSWTVDFFGLRKGDRFRVLYETRSCEGEFIGIGRIWYSIFSREGSDLQAIRYDQGDNGNLWWNEKGESMRKAFLKVPLQFKRISSGFSYARKHPVTGRVRPHTGVDYAAPKGTPVHSIGDGTVISAGWGGGGGNTVKIRHNSVYTSAYLHLSRFGKGIKAGTRVHQGQVIGYVGSTGTSTGPHLDFRVWKNGSPINPLKLESPPAEPIKAENKPALDSVRTMYRAQLDSLIAE